MPASDSAAPYGLATVNASRTPSMVRASASALTMLGYFRLQVRGHDTELPAAAQRLVALLALRGRISRSRAAGTLWPETTEHRALASLRTAIWRVNQVAPALVSCSGGGVKLDDTVSIDVRRLIQYGLAALAPNGADRGDIPVACLGVNLIELIEAESELLPDWEEQWLLTDRQRLRQLRLHLLEIIAARLTEEEHFGLAMEAALAAVRADDLRESAHRAVIKIHIAEGNFIEARRAYRTCRTLLVHGLGVEPSPMAARLLVASEGLGVPPTSGPYALGATGVVTAAASGAPS